MRSKLRDVLGNTAKVQLSMVHVEGRVLCSVDPGCFWHSFNPATTDTLDFIWEGTSSEISASARDIARKAAVHFYERFGWMDVPNGLLEEEGAKFVERRLGRAR